MPQGLEEMAMRVLADIRDTPCNAEVSPSVKKSEYEAKEERLEEASCPPVLSPICHLPPQNSNLYSFTVAAFLQLIGINMRIYRKAFLPTSNMFPFFWLLSTSAMSVELH